jgi:protein-disulfide isomerase
MRQALRGPLPLPHLAWHYSPDCRSAPTIQASQTIDAARGAQNTEFLKVKITRREFAIATGAVALTAVFGGLSSHGLGFGTVARAADDPTMDDLMKPGALPDIILGDENAPVTIIEYASMTCPHCAHFAEATYPELKKRYIDTGKVRYIMREFPLDPLAAAGFMLARCAPKDRYYPIIETLFQQQRSWVVQKPLEPLMTIAKQAGFTQQSFESCLNDRQLQTNVEAVRTQASEKFGVNSTPTFFINGKRYAGAIELAELEKMLQPLLKS